MSRPKKYDFKNPKMFSSRCEEDDFNKFEQLIRYRDNMSLQEFVNRVIIEYISGNLYLSGSKFQVK